MKKSYFKPAVDVTAVQMSSQVLAGSPIGPAPAPGVGATRNGYGNGGTDIW